MERPKIRSRKYSITKGHDAERLYAERFREIGYEFCKTARLMSRLLDNCNIDLAGIPLNVQVKCGFKKQRPNAEVIFTQIREDLKKNFPSTDPVHKYPKILIHKSQGYTSEGELVTMTWDDFLPFLIAYKKLADDNNNNADAPV